MQDRNAQLAIGIDVWVVDRTSKFEGWRAIRVSVGKGHLGLKIGAVESTVRVDNHEPNVPDKESALIILDVNPFFLL